MGVLIMVETDPQKIVTYTQNECRAKAAAKLAEAQTYLSDSDTESTQLALAAAQLWAMFALSAPKHEAPATPEDQRIPGVQLFSASDPEPDVNPGEILVDPSGGTTPYLLRLYGHKWMWCDSLAHAEATGSDGAGSWSSAMGYGLIRVRRATEREQVEFRSGSGGAALDLVRRLLSTLAGLARDSGHEHTARWLAYCDEHAHLSFSTWEWPEPAPSAPLPPLSESRQLIPPGVWVDLVHLPGRVLHDHSTPVLVTAADDGSAKFSAPVRWLPTAKNDDVCSAHGKAQCPSCSRSKGQLNPDGTCPECASFQVSGMHWDTCPHRDRSPLLTSGRGADEPRNIPQALTRAAELADTAGKKRTAEWLRACMMAYSRGQEWPAAPAYKGLVVHVENPQPDMEQLNDTTLTRLRDQIQALITKRAQTDESSWHPGDRIVARVGEHGNGGEYSGTVVYPTPDQVVPMSGVVVYFLRDEDGELRWARPKNVRAQTDAKVDDERWRAGTGGGILDYPRNARPPGGGGAAQWREG